MKIPVRDCWVEGGTTVKAQDDEGNVYTYTATKMADTEEAGRFARHIRDHAGLYTGGGINLSFWRKD